MSPPVEDKRTKHGGNTINAPAIGLSRHGSNTYTHLEKVAQLMGLHGHILC
jgi:hypothetical protein